MAGEERGKDGGIVDHGNTSWRASDLAGQSAAAARPAVSAHKLVVSPDYPDMTGSPDETISLTSEMRQHLDSERPPDDAGSTPTVEAEWALWGKKADETAYHVLRCSDGAFGLDDFREIITRYASGVKEELPQYTVCWIPSDQNHPSYLAVAIHELADLDPSRSGGRSRTVGGREIEYVRFFCVQYAEMKNLGLSYTGLIESVRKYQLDGDTAKLTVPLLPETGPYEVAVKYRTLAENVVALLLTTRPVCILGAEGTTAEERLRFIELVMSLLPYGLRTRLSASTWASSTAQHLKLRLYFANARRDDGGRTSHLNWGAPEQVNVSAPQYDAVRLYLRWLRDLGPRAAPALVGEVKPLRFTDADIRRMVANLPTDRSVTQTLEELGESLRKEDKAGIRTAVDRLTRHMASPQRPADRASYRQVIFQQRLLKDRSGLHPGIKENIYRVLLRLAFDMPLTYDSYCEIAHAIGGPPRGVLRSEMLRLHFASVIPFILTAKAEPGFRDHELAQGLASRYIKSTKPIDEVAGLADRIRPPDRAIVFDFAFYYLRGNSENAWRELRWRGYLAETLEILFHDNVKEQYARLEQILHFGYGESLSRADIDDLFDVADLHPTPALEHVAQKLAASSRANRYVAEQAALVRLSNAGYADDARLLTSGVHERSRPPIRERARLVPRGTIYFGIFCLVVFAFVIYLAVAAVQRLALPR